MKYTKYRLGGLLKDSCRLIGETLIFFFHFKSLQFSPRETVRQSLTFTTLFFDLRLTEVWELIKVL